MFELTVYLGFLSTYVDRISHWITYEAYFTDSGSSTVIQHYEHMIIAIFIALLPGIRAVFSNRMGFTARVVYLAATASLFVSLSVFFMDDTWYLLNLMTQSVGYYFFYLIKLAHHVDAFEKVDSGVDAKAQLTPWFDGWDGNGW